MSFPKLSPADLGHHLNRIQGFRAKVALSPGSVVEVHNHEYTPTLLGTATIVSYRIDTQKETSVIYTVAMNGKTGESLKLSEHIRNADHVIVLDGQGWEALYDLRIEGKRVASSINAKQVVALLAEHEIDTLDPLAYAATKAGTGERAEAAIFPCFLAQ